MSGEILEPARILESIRRRPEWCRRIRHWVSHPARAARRAELPPWMHPDLAAALRGRGIEHLWTHQREAADAIAEGRDVVLSTPAESGKAIAVALPLLSALAEGETGRALVLCASRRLARRRAGRLRSLAEALRRPVRVGDFDGDTPPSTRRPFRERVDVVVTTPEILHGRILPHHPHWAPVLRDLRWVILEDIERYDGVHGGQVANVVRRLRRIAAHHDARPTLVATGEAIANPEELAAALLGSRPVAMTESGAPRSASSWALVEPDAGEAAGRAVSVLDEARRLLDLVPAGAGSVVFTAAAGVGPLIDAVRRDRRASGRDPSGVDGYAIDDLTPVREEVERRFAEGSVRTLVLPHGVDPGPVAGGGALHVIAGCPGSFPVLRRELAAAAQAVVIAGPTTVDRALVRRPERLAEGAGPAVAIDPDNLVILLAQLQCAAYEIPFVEGETFGGVAETRLLLDHLEQEWRVLHRADDRWYWAASDYPADGVILRDVEWNERHATVRRVGPDGRTEPEIVTEVRVLAVDEGQDRDGYRIERGDVEVTRAVPRYRRWDGDAGDPPRRIDLDLPPEVVDADALWIGLTPRTERALGGFAGDRSRSLDGVAALLRRVVPLVARCRRSDLGAVAEVRSAHLGRATITLHETAAGGTGLTALCDDRFDRLLEAMDEVLTDCDCARGCPVCVGPESDVGAEGKAIAVALVRALRRAAPRRGRPRRGAERREAGAA